jgi:nucleoporin NUP159
MAFSFSTTMQGEGFVGQPASPTQPSAQEGPELKEIQTDVSRKHFHMSVPPLLIVSQRIGFQAIARNVKLKLLPSPWPADALPPPSASLLSVASSKGVLAAGGPDGVVVVKTDSARHATYAKAAEGDDIRMIEPEVKVPLPRPSHVLFSVDEAVLVLSPQERGGLIAYQVDELFKGHTQPALQIGTNNTGLRALIPNPSLESAELFAAVTTNGELLMADLKSGGLRESTDGVVLKTSVTCVSWSNRGKQLVAGLADGSAVQITPDGDVRADIPKPPALPENMHMSAMSWLENDIFFMIYTPNESSSDGMAPPSDYYIVSRQKSTANFAFQKLPEVVPAFGVDRLPSFQFISRLRNFEPHLQDLLVIASTTSGEIGTVTRADAPLSTEEPVTGDFTLTSTTDDSRRALLPISTTEGDTWPIGLALDLSSKESITMPIPGDDQIFESATPAPCLLVLNHEGILMSWWIVYSDSIREKTAYAGLVAAGDSSQTPQSQRQTPDRVTTQTTVPTQQTLPQSTGFDEPRFGKPTFGSPTTPSTGFGQPGLVKPNFGSATPFAKPTNSPFGALASTSSFGSGPSTFGTPSSLGNTRPSWTSTGFDSAKPQSGGSGFGQSSFGAATPIGGTTAPTFGTSSGLGARPSPFGQPAVPSAPANNATPVFGHTAGLGQRPGTPFGGGSAKSPFATLTSNENKPKGFGQFSSSGGFSDLKPSQPTSGSPFSKPGGDLDFAKTSGPSMLGDEPASSFGVKPNQGGNLFEGGTSFKPGSSFKGDGTAKDDLPRPGDEGNFSFESGLGDLLGEGKKGLSPTHDREAEMDESDTPTAQKSEPEPRQPAIATSQAPEGSSSLVTPPSTVMQSKATPAPPISNLFGASTKPTTTPTAAPTYKPPPTAESATTTPPSTATLFGTSTQPNTTPALVQNSRPGWALGHISSTTPKESPRLKPLPFETKAESPNETPKIKTEPSSDDDAQGLTAIPEAPLPPDPTSKTSYAAGDTSVSSINSKTPSDDAPLPPDFLPAKPPSNHDADEAELPEDEDLSSEYEGSEEDASEDLSAIEDHSEHTEQIHTSPESSSGRGGDNTQELNSPTGGLFTKVMTLDSSQRPSRPLFGEIGGPVFLPPKPQESPRSPSPIRHLLPNDILRPEAPRSVSAPSRPSVIDARKAELTKSNLANQKHVTGNLRQKEEERRAAAAEAKAKAEAEEALQLEDDEDERLRAELARPISPCEQLGPFLHHEQANFDDGTKSGIPGQIERLYQDINAMVDTLGINARSLSAFMLYQQSQEPNKDWPAVLNSSTPLDSLNDDWVLDDIMRLHEGDDVLQSLLEANKIANVAAKLQQCQDLLVKDLFQLKNKLISIRKAIHTKSDNEAAFSAPLSAEQASLQHDLRKASTSVQTKLVQVEQNLTMLRAKLAEISPASSANLNGASKASIARISPQKKPTVEAVTNTIAKMTLMAEKKSADIDVLEAQLRKMGLSSGSVNGSRQNSVEPTGTPQKAGEKLRSSMLVRTPASTTGSVYHTPDSKFGNSMRATPDTGRRSMRASLADMSSSISIEDKVRWREKARRKKEVEKLLKNALAERRMKKSLAARAS